jgi:hypothetical protein
VATIPLELSRAWIDEFEPEDLLALVAGTTRPSAGPVRVVPKDEESER